MVLIVHLHGIMSSADVLSTRLLNTHDAIQIFC